MLVIVGSRFLIPAARDAQSHTRVGGGDEVLGREGCVPSCCLAPEAEEHTFRQDVGRRGREPFRSSFWELSGGASSPSPRVSEQHRPFAHSTETSCSRGPLPVSGFHEVSEGPPMAGPDGVPTSQPPFRLPAASQGTKNLEASFPKRPLDQVMDVAAVPTSACDWRSPTLSGN